MSTLAELLGELERTADAAGWDHGWSLHQLVGAGDTLHPVTLVGAGDGHPYETLLGWDAPAGCAGLALVAEAVATVAVAEDQASATLRPEHQPGSFRLRLAYAVTADGREAQLTRRAGGPARPDDEPTPSLVRSALRRSLHLDVEPTAHGPALAGRVWAAAVAAAAADGEQPDRATLARCDVLPALLAAAADTGRVGPDTLTALLAEPGDALDWTSAALRGRLATLVDDVVVAAAAAAAPGFGLTPDLARGMGVAMTLQAVAAQLPPLSVAFAATAAVAPDTAAALDAALGARGWR